MIRTMVSHCCKVPWWKRKLDLCTNGAERATKVPLQSKGLVPRTNPFGLLKVDPVPIAIAPHGLLSTLNNVNHHGLKGERASGGD